MACNLLHSVEHMQRNVGGCLHRHFVHAEYRLMHMYFPFTVAYICLPDSYIASCVHSGCFLRTIHFRTLLFIV